MAELTNTSRTGAIEILQHWGTEGVEPLDDAIDSFERENPNASVSQRTVPVSKLRLTAKSEVLRGSPPDLWVEWPGKNLRSTVEAGAVADVTDLWESTGLVDHVVSGAKDAARFEGRYRCLPTDMYRINNLFYDVEVLERAGVDVDRLGDPAGFVDALDAIDDVAEGPPITLFAKDPFGPLQLWETLLLAVGGRDTYGDLLEGKTAGHREPVARAVTTLAEIMEYAPADVAFVSSEQSDNRFVEGRGAVTHNGGWAVGRIKAGADFEYGSDWAAVPFPGTEDVYQMNMNALVPAEQSAVDETVQAFLRHVAAPETLAAVNDHLGAVPPRDDIAVGDLHPVIQRHYRALDSTAHHAPSMTHGLGVSPETLTELKAAAVSFVAERDVDATTRALLDALG